MNVIAESESGASWTDADIRRNRRNMLRFQVFNAVNFSIAMGMPMVLLANFLGAREGLIGFLLSLPPYLMGLQLVGARVSERVGYRRMMLAGWRARALVLIFMVPLPLLAGHVPGGWLLGVLCAAMLAYTTLRGFASSSWIPWVRWLIPPSALGRYFGQELQTAWRGELLTVIGCGLFLGASAPGWRYAVLFATATSAGLLSARFLAELPEHPDMKRGRAGDGGRLLPLDGIATAWRQRAFRRVVRYAAVNELFTAAVPGFLVVFLKEELRMTPMHVLFTGSLATAGAMAVSAAIGRWSDHFGSRPFMRLSGMMRVLVLGYWLAASLGRMPTGPVWIGAAYVLMGASMAMNAVAMARLALGACPPSEVGVGWAFLQVVIAVLSGTAPLACGVLLQHLGEIGGMPAYALLFGIAGVAALVAQALLSRIPEPKASSTQDVVVRLFLNWPARLLSGYFGGPR